MPSCVCVFNARLINWQKGPRKLTPITPPLRSCANLCAWQDHHPLSHPTLSHDTCNLLRVDFRFRFAAVDGGKSFSVGFFPSCRWWVNGFGGWIEWGLTSASWHIPIFDAFWSSLLWTWRVFNLNPAPVSVIRQKIPRHVWCLILLKGFSFLFCLYCSVCRRRRLLFWFLLSVFCQNPIKINRRRLFVKNI